MNNIFLSVLEVSVLTGLIVIAIMLLEPLLNKRYAARWKYWIWVILAVRLVIPLNINVPEYQIKVEIPMQMTTPLTIGNADMAFLTPDGAPEAGAAANGGKEVAAKEQPKSDGSNMTLLDIATAIWLMGSLTVLSIHLCSYFRCRKQLSNRGIPVSDGEILCQLKKLSDELHIKCEISVIEYSEAVSPMIIGFLNPILVLPQEQHSREELYFILKHELIHLKRHDVYFKLLLMTAGAIHWFNPLVWIMQKESTVDMELSCDERVVWGADYAVRKAYTETLFSTLHRRCNRKTVLSTQFYGTVQIMKKRFYNILIMTKKKNGILLVCTVIVTLCMGMLVGCSAVGAPLNIPNQELVRNNPAKQDEIQAAQDSGFLQGSEAPTVPEEIANSHGDNGENLSVDALEVKNVAEALAAAYFADDKASLLSLLTDPYEWDIDVYEGVESDKGAGETNIIALKGLNGIGEKNIDDICVISVEFSDTQYDTLFYLTIELVKQADGWKVYFYGLEG